MSRSIFAPPPCSCTPEMKSEHGVALCDFEERLRAIRAAHPDLVNKRWLG